MSTKQIPNIRVVTLSASFGTNMFRRVVRDEDGEPLYQLDFKPGEIHIFTEPQEIEAIAGTIELGGLIEAEFTDESRKHFVDAIAPKATKQRIEELESRVAELELELEAMSTPAVA